MFTTRIPWKHAALTAFFFTSCMLSVVSFNRFSIQTLEKEARNDIADVISMDPKWTAVHDLRHLIESLKLMPRWSAVRYSATHLQSLALHRNGKEWSAFETCTPPLQIDLPPLLGPYGRSELAGSLAFLSMCRRMTPATFLSYILIVAVHAGLMAILVVRASLLTSLNKEVSQKARISALLQRAVHDMAAPLTVLNTLSDDRSSATHNLSKMAIRRLRGILADVRADTTHFISANNLHPPSAMDTPPPGDFLLDVRAVVADVEAEARHYASLHFKNAPFTLTAEVKSSPTTPLGNTHCVKASVSASTLTRILSNLSRNSIEALATSTRQDPLSLKIDATIENQQLTFVVADSGPGIPKDHIVGLSEGRSFTTKPQGSGIGLSSAIAYMKRHQGEVQIDSSPVGTRVTVRVPIA